MQYRRTVIALDFDRTFTADRVLWGMWLAMAVARGHSVYCVTARSDKPENRKIIFRTFGERLHTMLAGVIFTAHKPKRAFMEQLGIHVDNWCDDAPETVGQTDPAVITALREYLPSDETLELLDDAGCPIVLYPAAKEAVA